MKKVFLIFSMAGCLSLVNGINNANAVQSEDVIVTFVCPDGCNLFFGGTTASSETTAVCLSSDNTLCSGPSVEVGHIVYEEAHMIEPNISSQINVKPSKNDKVKLKKLNKVSARSAETPKAVKKIVYEVITDEE